MNSEKMLKIIKEQGIKGKDLADQAGIPVGTLNKIIYGITKDPSVNLVANIAHVLGYKVDDFIDNDDDNSNKPESIAAHHDGEWTEGELEEIKQFKEWVRSKRK